MVVQGKVLSFLRFGSRVIENLLHVEIAFGQFYNCLDHHFAAVNEIRFFKRIILLEALADDDGQLGAAQNNLRAVVLFL